MTRLLQRLTAPLRRLLQPARDRVLARLRAHVALAVNDDLRRVVLHVTSERVALSAELTRRIAAELTPVHQRLDDVNLCNDALLREVVRLQRGVQELSEAVERLSLVPSASEPLPAAGPLGDVPRLKLVDDRQVRAA